MIQSNHRLIQIQCDFLPNCYISFCPIAGFNLNKILLRGTIVIRAAMAAQELHYDYIFEAVAERRMSCALSSFYTSITLLERH